MATAFPEKKDIGSTTSEMANKVQDKLGEAANKAKDFGNTVGQKMSDAASFVGQKAEDATHRMGAGIKSLSGTLREHAPHSGMAGSASSAVADSLEKTGRYLEERGLGGVCNDLGNVIRRNPIPALLIGIGAGFLLARATSRR
jgi:hypothetical protein